MKAPHLKKFCTENNALKCLSFVIAIFLWLLCVNVSKPEITDTKTLPLSVINKGAFDADSKTWNIDRTTVTISYRVRSDVRSKISASDFNAYVNLGDYSITGSVPVYVDKLNNIDNLIEDLTIRPSVVKVNIENVQEKKFDVETKVIGKPKAGYSVSNVIVSPESVYLTGPESEIGRISKVGIHINVEGLYSNKQGTAELLYYDANGNQINVQNVTSSQANLNYAVNFHKEKTITLLSSVTGTPATGYQYESMTISPDSVKLAAAASVIDNMSVFELPAVDLSGATDTLTVSYHLADYLPVGVELSADSPADISITARIEKIPETEPESTESAENNGNSPFVPSESAGTAEHENGSNQGNDDNNASSPLPASPGNKSAAEGSSPQAAAASSDTQHDKTSQQHDNAGDNPQ